MSLSHSNQRGHRSRRNLSIEVALNLDQGAPYRLLEGAHGALGDPLLLLEGAPATPLRATVVESETSPLHSDRGLGMSPHINSHHSRAIDLPLRHVSISHHKGYLG